MLLNCKYCGGELNVTEGAVIAECKYCRTKQTLPKASDEGLQNLFNRANALRRRNEFDKAEAVFEKIVELNGNEAEAYWGLILSKYGIEYVEDPESGKMIPTCHRASFDSIVSDGDYKSAIEYADAERRTLYEEQAREIDRIQRDILKLSENEEKFDIFICYKETDENGKRTRDSVTASEIYYELTDAGLKVFYAAITLEGKLGSEYEPIIFAALNSAKVMLVIGSKPEYFNAVWVKNEWSRFLKIMKKDRKKRLIPCYRDMDAYDLPEEFAHIQAQNMEKIAFLNDLIHGVKKVMEDFKEKPAVVIKEKETVVKEPVITQTTVIRETGVSGAEVSGGTSVVPLLKRVFAFLEDGEFDSADEYCERVLDIELENPLGYLGKLMAALKVKTREELKGCDKPFDSNINYKKAIRYGDEALKTELNGYLGEINERIENARKESVYLKAMDDYKSRDLTRIENAIRAFISISGYKDSGDRVKACEEKIERLRRAEDEAREKARLEAEEKEKKRLLWQQSLKERKEREEAERFEREEQARLEKERRKKRKSKLIAAIISLVSITLAVIIVVNAVIIPNGKYNSAIKLMQDGSYSEAITVFEGLKGYKDSETKINFCNVAIYGEDVWNKIKAINVGDSYYFGTCEQDGDISNGKEKIEWIVLAKEGSRIFVVSKYVLDAIPFNSGGKTANWENCSLRTWLNDDFLNTAFIDDEKAMIPTVSVDNSYGNPTEDRLFLLSIGEVSRYFKTEKERLCKATQHAKTLGADGSGSYVYWWLRSSGGDDLDRAANVSYDGSIIRQYINFSNRGVRPAMWIEIK